jgi:pimeloyl-ACP methyl ester carboxylesterase
MLSRVEESVGAGILRVVQFATRRALRARLKHHTDARGRVTPYLECGVARKGTIVWLHGFSDEPDSFLRAAAFLVRDYRVVMPALPGFADGWLDPSERHTFQAYATWLSEVVGAIGGKRFHLMGNSLGGGAAMGVAAALGPERIASLVVVNSGGLDLPGVLSVNDEMRAGKNLFSVRERADYRRFLERVFAQPPFIPRPVFARLAAKLVSSADWYERVVADMLQSSFHAAAEGASCTTDLASLRMPTLVVWGDRDTLFPAAHGAYLARTIAGARLEVLPGVGHCPHLESPKRLAQAFLRFAATLPETRANG